MFSLLDLLSADIYFLNRIDPSINSTLNRPLAKVLFLTILDFDIYLKINAYH